MTQVCSVAEEVTNRLTTLGLTESELIQAIKRGILARSEVTLNHPPLHAGFVTWSTTVCALREILIPKGWERNDEGNYSVVIDPSRSFSIAVATGNEDTGNPNATPTTKSPKGPSTRSAVEENLNQMTLFPELAAIVDGNSGEGRLTWLLLLNHDGDKVKSELSLPINCNGKVDAWQERIILPEIDLDPIHTISITPDLPNMPDIDIDVRRIA
jgi:hypothetical protein